MVSGLLASARLYLEQIPALWRFGPVTIADHTRDDSMAAIAQRILAQAPPEFALVGLSMGGYISLEIMRQAGDRVSKLALLDTSARPDRPDQTKRRRSQIEAARDSGLEDVIDQQFPLLVDRSHREDAALYGLVKAMAREVGPEAFVRQQMAIISRVDSRPDLAAIACPTLVVVGEGDQLTPPDLSRELVEGIAGSTLEVIPECGHLSTLEQPQVVTRALVKWLKS